MADSITIDASNAHHWSGGFGDSAWAPEQRGMFVADGAFYIRQMLWPKGENHDGHSHWIDHVGNLVSGAAIVRWRDEADASLCGEYHMLVPSKIPVLANRWHHIEFLEDSVWECWFAKAEADRIYGDAALVPWHLEKDRVRGPD